MNSIYEALQSGYSPKKILDFLKKLDPALSGKIALALQAGHSAEKVLSFIAKGGKNVSSKLPESSNIYQQATTSVHPSIPAAAKVGAGIATIAAPFALGRSISPKEMIGSLTPKIEGQNTIPFEQPPNLPPTEDKQPINPIPESDQQEKVDPEQILRKLDLKKHVDKIKDKYRDPKEIAAILYMDFPKEMKDFQKKVGKPMEDAIGDYLGSQTKEMTQELSNIESQGEKLDVSKETPKIEKNLIVASPQGIGQVKSISGDNVIIDIAGKTHQANQNDLIASPLPEKDLADLYNDLVQGIEKEGKQEVSRNVYWAGYDPKTNELAYVPHDGALYIYDDISPDDAKELTSLLNQRKSSGQNYLGAWSKGTQSPIGSAMYQLIKKLQSERGGKGKEYSGKFEKLYDALELAKKAAKKKHEEKRKTKKSRTD